MVTVKCVKKLRDSNNNNIIGYRILDQHGKWMDVYSEPLKRAITNGEIVVLNLKLTSDNRLIDDKFDYEKCYSELFKDETDNYEIKLKTETSTTDKKKRHKLSDDERQEKNVKTYIRKHNIKTCKFSRDYKTILEYNGMDTILTLPPVQIIGKWAFKSRGYIRNVVIPDTVTEILDGAFYDCKSLTSVKISGSVKEIGIKAFSDCKFLKNIEICDGVNKIGAKAFCGCKRLESIDIPSSVKEIGEGAFFACNSMREIILHRIYPDIKKWNLPMSCRVTYK